MTGEVTTYIFGKHAVREAVKYAPAALLEVFVKEDRVDEEFEALLRKAGVKASLFDPKKLPKGIEKDAVHQGVIGVLDTAKLMKSYKEFMVSFEVTPSSAFVLLGEVQDPHNVGAVIRSAAAFGVAGILIPEHNQAPITGTVVKVSAGMAFHIPLISIGNVNNTVRDLKKRGFWIYGLDGEATQSVTDEKFEKPSVFILGNESKGIREKTMDLCDIPLRIPTHPQCESLNAAVSASIVLYAWSAQHSEILDSVSDKSH